MNTTSRKIIQIIYKNRTTTIDDLRIILGVTKADIRHHLYNLKSDNLIEILGKRISGRGRPELIYGLSHKMLGDALPLLSTLLLVDVFYSGQEQEKSIRALASRMKERLYTNSGGSLHNQLSSLVGIINKYHYQAHWEASESGAKLTYEHCPYKTLLDEHPKLCILEIYFLEECIGRKISQVSRLDPSVSGLPKCEFLIM